MLMFAVGLAAITEMVDFNVISNLTDLFNPSTSAVSTNASTGGLGDSGYVSHGSVGEIWTHKKGFAIPGTNESVSVSAYFWLANANYGHGGLGFAIANINQKVSYCSPSSNSMGTHFKRGSGSFLNNTDIEDVSWGVDMSLNAWYKMSYTLTNKGSSVFDATIDIWPSDSDGILGTQFAHKSRNGLTNMSFTEGTTVFPYFGFDDSCFSKMDNFEMPLSELFADTDFSGAGAGTAASPYVITTPGQLNQVRNFLDSNFILANDIDLNVSPYNTGEGWVPIGVPGDPYTLLDLSLAQMGFFTITGPGSSGGEVTTGPIHIPADMWEIQMWMENAGFASSASVADLGGQRYALYNIISVNLDIFEGSGYTQEVTFPPFSGIFDGNGKTISNLYINRTASEYQGLFGKAGGATLKDLSLTGVSVTGYRNIGALLGQGSSTVISNCHSMGSITGSAIVGGLAGLFLGTVSNCSSTGAVVGTYKTPDSMCLVGGLIGFIMNTSINSSYSTSNVSGLLYGWLGGLVGYADNSSLNNCYARGSVTTGNSACVGGLVGYIELGNVTNCYSTGAVIGTGLSTGGMFGTTEECEADGCYWDTETSMRTNATGEGDAVATACSTDNMTYTYNAFSDWDFVNIWREDVFGTMNNGYPYLALADYLEGVDVQVGEAVITVTGGNANNGAGSIPGYTGLVFVPEQTFSFIGSGTLTITITTTAQYGAYWQASTWHPVTNSGGQLVFVINFDAKGEVPVVIGNEDQTLPVELSSFTAVETSLNYVQLNWTTQSESGLIGYYVYRGAISNISGASSVSALISATNTSQTQNYSFVDNDVSQGTWYYWLQNLDMDGSSNYFGPISVTVTDGDNETPDIPQITSLNNIYPNPFNPSTTISYGLAKAEKVNIQIYNVKGQLVHNLVSETKQTGNYRIVWNGTNDKGQALTSGMYIVKMTAGAYSRATKVIVMK